MRTLINSASFYRNWPWKIESFWNYIMTTVCHFMDDIAKVLTLLVEFRIPTLLLCKNRNHDIITNFQECHGSRYFGHLWFFWCLFISNQIRLPPRKTIQEFFLKQGFCNVYRWGSKIATVVRRKGQTFFFIYWQTKGTLLLQQNYISLYSIIQACTICIIPSKIGDCSLNPTLLGHTKLKCNVTGLKLVP